MPDLGKLEKCMLWKAPEAMVGKGLKERFERIETYGQDSHWWRYLLQCRDCGQMYVYDFHETIDWISGKDPQFVTWIPVTTEQEIDAAKTASRAQRGGFVPRLCEDWPADQDKKSIYWVKAEQS